MLLAPGRHVETVEFEQLGVTLHQIDRRFLGASAIFQAIDCGSMLPS